MRKDLLTVCFGFVLLLAVSAFAGSPIEPAGRIPIGPGNPRNGEGDFILLKDGTIRYFYTSFRSGNDDFDAADLMYRDSSDGGKTWTGESRLALPNEGSVNTMSVTVRRLPDGRIALFYLVKDRVDDKIVDCRPFMRISEDETNTWGERTALVPDHSYNVVNNDRVEILPGGRILVPVARHGYNDNGTITGTSEVFCLISDDSGVSWREGKRAPVADGVIYQEPGVCRLADGRVLMNIRTDAGSQYFAYSSDSGESWTQPEPSPLASPLSPALIKRIPGSDLLLAVWNPLREGHSGWTGSRALVSYGVLSPDGTELFDRCSLIGEIDSDDQNWQYPAILFLDDGTFLTAFFSWKSGVDLYKIPVPRPENR
ncbi:MAG: exo-alpha-sialidase [Thermoguttaceae bacterium]|nr:exo-alpha-sialidase [Thermoguttaceae bacterium]